MKSLSLHLRLLRALIIALAKAAGDVEYAHEVLGEREGI